MIPNGVITVQQGESKTFAYAMLAGYQNGKLLIDGGVQDTGDSLAGNYTFNNVSENHTIELRCSETPPPPTPKYWVLIPTHLQTGAAVSTLFDLVPATSTQVLEGGSLTVKIKNLYPTNYIQQFQINSNPVTMWPKDSEGYHYYTFTNITQNQSVNWTYNT